MAQKIVTLCDACQVGTDDEVPGQLWTVTIQEPGQKPTTWDVDLCADHGKQLADVAVMLGAVGRVTAGTAKARRTAARQAAARESAPASGTAHTAPPHGSMVPEPCPVEGCEAVPSTRKALVSHLRSAHDGMSLAKAYGRPEPYSCPEPGCGFTSSRPQGIGAHVHAVHRERAAESLAG